MTLLMMACLMTVVSDMGPMQAARASQLIDCKT
jgi:hypothetical protein